MDDDALRRAVRNMFGSDSRFRRMLNSRHLYYADIEGTAVGVVLATYNENFSNCALNKKELERLLEGLASGKISAAYVANVKLQSRTVVEVADASKVYAKLQDVLACSGPYGEFWTSSIFTDEEEPSLTGRWKRLLKKFVAIANANGVRLNAAEPEDADQMIAEMIADCDVMLVIWKDKDEGIELLTVKGESLMAKLVQNRISAEEIDINVVGVPSKEDAELLLRQIDDKPLS